MTILFYFTGHPFCRKDFFLNVLVKIICCITGFFFFFFFCGEKALQSFYSNNKTKNTQTQLLFRLGGKETESNTVLSSLQVVAKAEILPFFKRYDELADH